MTSNGKQNKYTRKINNLKYNWVELYRRGQHVTIKNMNISDGQLDVVKDLKKEIKKKY